MNLQDRLTAMIGDKGRPASADDLRRMDAIAPLPPDLRALYQRDAELFREGFELFEPSIYEDVNGDTAAFGELADMIYFADDQAGGFYFTDPGDLLGLGRGFFYWTDRSMMAADEVVPLAEDLSGFLGWLDTGADPRMLPSLGQRAIDRLQTALAARPASVDAAPPVDRAAFRQAREERELVLTRATGEVLLLANGIYFTKVQRQIHGIDRMMPLMDGTIAVVGFDPKLGYLGVTRGDWRDVPADRLIAFPDMDRPEDGQILGRFADVLSFWIEEARQP